MMVDTPKASPVRKGLGIEAATKELELAPKTLLQMAAAEELVLCVRIGEPQNVSLGEVQLVDGVFGATSQEYGHWKPGQIANRLCAIEPAVAGQLLVAGQANVNTVCEPLCAQQGYRLGRRAMVVVRRMLWLPDFEVQRLQDEAIQTSRAEGEVGEKQYDNLVRIIAQLAEMAAEKKFRFWHDRGAVKIDPLADAVAASLGKANGESCRGLSKSTIAKHIACGLKLIKSDA